MQNMINKQGALLKFKHHFNLLVKDRDLEPIHVEDEEEKEGKEKNAASGRLSLETIKEESKIYGRYNKQSKLSEWQKAVNKAAFDLCAQEPDKMYHLIGCSLNMLLKKKQGKHMFSRKLREVDPNLTKENLNKTS